MCTVRLRHKDETAKYRFFLMPGIGPAPLGVSDIELVGTLRIMCEVMGDPHKSRMFDSQTMQKANGPSCKANKVQQIK